MESELNAIDQAIVETPSKEEKRSFTKQAYHPHNWPYDENDDVYWCDGLVFTGFYQQAKMVHITCTIFFHCVIKEKLLHQTTLLMLV